jgi:hypothetical protein
MNIDRFMTGLLSAAIASAAFAGFLTAQSSPRATAPVADLNQLMRGLFFLHANVVFSAQRRNPAEIKWASEPSASTDPLTGVFGSWEAVENSALIMTEAADLLMTPGRKCSNGRDVPLAKPEWAQFVNELREAGMVAYKAAQSKDQDNIIKASDVLNTACSDCHSKYRPRAIANRCQ